MVTAKHCVAGMAFLALTSCAPIPWHRADGLAGPEQRAQFNVVNARCRQAARDSDRGMFAFGAPAFVAGAAVGHAMSASANGREVYRDCMISAGYIEGDISQ